MTDETIAGLLQALEHTADMVDRLSTVLQEFIQAQQCGEVLDPAVVADYAAQLRTVQTQRAHLRQAITAWWQMAGDDTAH